MLDVDIKGAAAKVGRLCAQSGHRAMFLVRQKCRDSGHTEVLIVRPEPVISASCITVNSMGMTSRREVLGAVQCAGFWPFATMTMPIRDTPNPIARAHDKGSLNITQAQIIVTGGLTYKTAVTRAGVDLRSAK